MVEEVGDGDWGWCEGAFFDSLEHFWYLRDVGHHFCWACLWDVVCLGGRAFFFAENSAKTRTRAEIQDSLGAQTSWQQMHKSQPRLGVF
jgi:hypothetical protein